MRVNPPSTPAFVAKLHIWLPLMIVLVCASFESAHAQIVVINEIMANNATSIADLDGDYPDWIELHNPGVEAISLLGYGLSDDSDTPFKWVFPDAMLQPNDFILLFASGKDRTLWPGELHTNFRIAASGEEIVLTAPDGTTIDLLDPLAMEADVSYGRVPDGGGDWWFFVIPTPESSNGQDPPLQRSPPPTLWPSAGFYAMGSELTLHCEDPTATIYFTLDGSIPTDSSFIYENPLVLESVTVVRAISITPGMLPSHPASGTYIVGYSSTLPVMSLMTAPANLWDEETGIYVEGPNAEPEPPHFGANYWQDWEIPAHVQFFEPDGPLGFFMEAGLRIHGGYMRMLPQKSFRITGRDRYGPDHINYQLFPDEAVRSFKSLVLRNAGQDWDRAMIRDPLMTGLAHEAGIGRQAYRPTVVFLNGDYWGIYNIRERLDRNYISSHYGVNRDNVDVIEGHVDVEAGDRQAYDALTAFIRDHDMTQTANYDSVRGMMDIENFIRYQVSEIYFANTDWPITNIRCWRPKRPGGRFQWLIHDTDIGFGGLVSYDHNTLEFATAWDSDYYANPPHATLLLRRLIQNESFRSAFIVSFCDLLNLYFHADHVCARIDELRNGIAAEMPAQEARWYPDHDWEPELDILREFALLREPYVQEHLRTKFGLGEMATLTIESPMEEGGRVYLNSFLLESLPWQGEYFTSLPMELHAEPFTGYMFSGWEGDLASTETSICFALESDIMACPRFEPASGSLAAVVITEINYHSADDIDPGDWIEILALHGDHDLSGWAVRDDDDLHCYIIPAGTAVSQGQCLILASDRQAFESHFPTVSPVLGDLGFNFGNSGDAIRIYDRVGRLIDQVVYDDKPPWPPQADGDGSTLQLLDASYANELPRNWRASLCPHGDPGIGPGQRGPSMPNALKPPDEHPLMCRLEAIYPNPARATATTIMDLSGPSHFTLRLFDMNGRLVRTLADRHISAGRVSVPFTLDGLASGTYFMRAMAPGCATQIRPIIVVR